MTDLRAVVAIAGKDLLLLVRDRMGLFWALGFPLIMALFFGLLGSGGGGKLRLAVDDQDGSAESRALVAALIGNDGLLVAIEPVEQARARLALGKLAAVLVVPPGWAGGEKLVELVVDPGQRGARGLLTGLVQREVIAGLAARDDRFAEILRERVRVSDAQLEGARPRSAFEISFPASILWGLLGCIASFAVLLVGERTRGTWQRLRIAPLSRADVLAGKALACYLACLGVCVVLLSIGVLGFGVRVGSPGLLLAAVAASSACFVGLMVFCASLGKSENAVSGASWGLLIPMQMLGGGMIPLAFMPTWMTTLSHVSPVKWSVQALEGAIWRGFDLPDMLLPIGVLSGMGLASFAIGVALMKD